MNSNDRVSVVMERSECEVMREMLLFLLDNFVDVNDTRDYRIMDYCSRIGKRIDDALKGE